MVKLKREIGAFIFIGFLLLIGYVIPITLTLGNQEISNPDIAFQLNLFSTFLLVGLVGSGFLYYARFLWKGDDKIGNSFGFFNIGEKVKFFKGFTALQLIIYSVILFTIIALVSTQFNLGGFTGLKVLPQQFSPTESLVFSSLLIPIGEEALSIFVTGILVLVLVLLALKYKEVEDNFPLFYFGVIPLTKGILAIVWHSTAYQGSDVALITVFFFWVFKELLILTTGFFGVGIVMHWANNFFIDFSRLFADNVVFGFAIGVIAVMVALALFLYRGRLLGKKT